MIKINQLSFKNRISLYFILYSAMILLVVFIVIFQLVKKSVNDHINIEIQTELNRHYQEIEFKNDKVLPLKKEYWKEKEHISYTINPVFVQIFNKNKSTVDYSPNLKHDNLKLKPKNYIFYDVNFNNTQIRQIQKPIVLQSKIKGYIVVAMALKDLEVVEILQSILMITYPILILFLFFIAQFFSGKSIKPVNSMIKTSEKITQNNFSARIPLPVNKDELYYLSSTINSLLTRIETAIAREKQFTTDASHELRTPLAVIKGTLEVLIRKPRTSNEYQEKIIYCVKEIDTINQLIDQLLLLARFENQKQNIKHQKCFLNAIILDSLTHFSTIINQKNIVVKTVFDSNFEINSDQYLLSIVFNNLLSNALKYCNDNGEVFIKIVQNNKNLLIEIQDNGLGIPQEDLQKIFQPFFRSSQSMLGTIKGTGLGLSIVKRLCELLEISIDISSELSKGTRVSLLMKKK
jgi:signal transduction histidine kinase